MEYTSYRETHIIDDMYEQMIYDRIEKEEEELLAQPIVIPAHQSGGMIIDERTIYPKKSINI